MRLAWVGISAALAAISIVCLALALSAHRGHSNPVLLVFGIGSLLSGLAAAARAWLDPNESLLSTLRNRRARTR